MTITPEEAREHVGWPERGLRETLQLAVEAIDRHVEASIRNGPADIDRDSLRDDRSVINVSIAPPLRSLRDNHQSRDWPEIAWQMVLHALERRYSNAGWDRFELDLHEETASLWYRVEPLE